MGTAADSLTARLEPLRRAYGDPDGILASLTEAVAEPAQIVDDVARDTDTHVAWAAALDPAVAPPSFLAWLAQFPGVKLPPSADEAEQRVRIAQAAGFFRGTTDAEIAEIQLVLTGTKTVRVVERVNDDQWAQTIVTSPAETPDPAAVMAAWLRQKPVGVKPFHVVSAEPIIDEGELAIDAVGGTITIDNATLDDIQ